MRAGIDMWFSWVVTVRALVKQAATDIELH